MGPEEWSFIPKQHGLATAVAGFTPDTLLAATYSVMRQKIEGRPFLDNCYPSSVRPGGNPGAKNLLHEVFEIFAAPWRGVGTIPNSGLRLKPQLAQHDARQIFVFFQQADNRRRVGEMPPGCDCARVVMGKLSPNDCRLYGKPCTPRAPVGPCMVSHEGACRIWWSSGTRSK
jgi:hydrogenase expression/formation protein HypD